MNKTAQKKLASAKGFTLVELIVVIAIIAILAAVLLLVINPVELLRRGRDATRLSDMATLQQAISVELQDTTASNPLCNGSAYPCGPNTASTSNRAINGTGWVSVNFTLAPGASKPTISFAVLPIDPSTGGSTCGPNNNLACSYMYAVNASGGYELGTALESQLQQPKAANDGGDNNNYYEVGTDLTAGGATF